MTDLSAYLRRIHFDGPVRADLATLRMLHRLHGQHICYENFDVHFGRPMTIDPRAAFDKLVQRRRGGWCYEMNGVFGLVLDAIGFNVRRLRADGSTPATHLVLIVDLDGATYVADVGFSDGPPEPYPLREGAFTQDGFEFRVEFEPDGRWRLHNHRFGAVPGFLAHGPDEAGMEARCQWLQTDPESNLAKHIVVFGRTSSGYRSLIDRVLRAATSQGSAKHIIDTPDEYVATLRSNFGLDLPEAAALWPRLCGNHEVYLRESAARARSRNS